MILIIQINFFNFYLILILKIFISIFVYSIRLLSLLIIDILLFLNFFC